MATTAAKDSDMHGNADDDADGGADVGADGANGAPRPRAGAYRVASTLGVRHAYFSAGWPAGLNLRPDPATAALMARFNLLLRGDARRYVMLAGEETLEGLWSERSDWLAEGLAFTVESPDPLWAYYTDVRMLAASGQGMPARLRWPLAPPGCDSLAAWRAAGPAEHVLTLPVRRTIWKYLLVGDWGDDMRVVDAGNAVQFADAERETLPDGKTAVVIRSLTALALEERPRHRFQLRRGSGGNERVVLARMPMAAPAALRREVIDGVLRDVSEIFVNR